jgi:hypothetical protein
MAAHSMRQDELIGLRRCERPVRETGTFNPKPERSFAVNEPGEHFQLGAGGSLVRVLRQRTYSLL